MGSYRLAPEWARQDAVILVWPHSYSDWADSDNRSQLEAIEKTYIELSGYISRHQKLILVSYNPTHQQHIQKTLANHDTRQDNITFIDIITNDTWVRDYGPITVASDSELTLLDFKFNAWGNKYDHKDDDAFNQHLKQKINSKLLSQNINFVLEAGNLEINEQGILLSSSSCFTRNSHQQELSLLSLEQDFESWFGCNRVLWINDVILKGDDTDGHIDTLARYCTDDIVVYTAVGNNSDPNNEALNSLSAQLNKMQQSEATISELVPLPSPKPIFNHDKQLPATYANFLISNKYIFVPVFNDQQDNYALKTIDDLFPKHEIIDIESSTLIQQFGGIHCATMQVPEGFL